VQQEVRDGIISIQVARDLYGVALDPETLDILEAQTASLRTTKR
jgi:hypothetical protein